MTPVEALTHDDLGEIAARKLKNLGYIACFANMNGRAGGEQPDAIGVKSCGETFLVEAKVSRADFFSDVKKPWRSHPKAIGHYRAYITPKGLVKPEEVPYGWQLWEVHGKNKPIVKIIKGETITRERSPHFPNSLSTYGIRRLVNCDNEEYQYFTDKCCQRSVSGWLAAILSRADMDGVDVKAYARMATQEPTK